MARTVARAIQDLLGKDAEQLVKIRLASGALLMGWLDDLQQFDEAAILVEPNGRRTVIPLASIAAVELDSPPADPTLPRIAPAASALS